MSESNFLQTIYQLRTEEHIILYQQQFDIQNAEEADVRNFLKDEFTEEQLEHPSPLLAFDDAAAVWAAKIIYTSAQLLLYRQQDSTDLEKLLPYYEANLISPEAMISADLCLRFLPGIVLQFENMHPTDPVLERFEHILNTFHYSKIGYTTIDQSIDTSILTQHKGLELLYINRIVERKDALLAKHPTLHRSIQVYLGLHTRTFWPEFPISESPTL